MQRNFRPITAAAESHGQNFIADHREHMAKSGDSAIVVNEPDLLARTRWRAAS